MSAFLNCWKTAVISVVTLPGFAYLGIRKLVRGVNFSVEGEYWRQGLGISYVDLGFKGAKRKQLQRTYFNPMEIQKANKILKTRIKENKPQTSVGIRMGFGEKDKRSMGYCIQAIVVTHFGGKIYLDVFYRSTEVIKKFLADLKFIHEDVTPAILNGVEAPIESVTFHLSNAFLSIMFLPLLYRFCGSVTVLQQLESDKKLWSLSVAAMKKLIDPKMRYGYRSRQRMQEYFREHCFKRDLLEIKTYLKEKS